MPVFEYKALDKSGKTTNGIVDADSAVGARQKLRGTGLFPVEVRVTASKTKEQEGPAQTSLSTLFQRIKPAELSVMTRQLSILLGAGVTLVASLDTLILQITNPLFKKILAQVKESVNEGNSLAFTLSKHPKIFSQIYVNMVRAGEASGSLDLVLERLAEFGERQEIIRGRFKAAMAYPTVMLFIGTAILFFLVTFIVPQIAGIFKDLKQTLPVPTLILIAISGFLKSFWWLILMLIAGIIVLLRQLVKTPKGRYVWDKIILTTPMFGDINVKMAMARFGRTLGSLVQNGVPLLSALEIVRNIVNNTLIAKDIDEAMEKIGEGKSLAAPLSQSRWFPPIAIQMIAVGEQSGELERLLNKIADIYEGETESKVMALTAMLEPLMILFMAISVAFIVFSILLPIFEINQMVH
ncbi:General secretion pathway protein F [uncultured Desulfobacterium sp.]|uniref:General secretion pathway protein F n=1 Tax=uncultured Desulfobacterium sp. TaxID=201089 RepID=A0A445MSM1_9BACT|nr:General secretion pathway protein F [uncultured Desulfobacterium sp.]